MTSRALVIISLFGHVLKLAGAAVLARVLGAQHYDEYAVAVASIVVLSTLAEFGLGKVGLKVVPLAVSRGDLSLARRYVSFALTLTIT